MNKKLKRAGCSGFRTASFIGLLVAAAQVGAEQSVVVTGTRLSAPPDAVHLQPVQVVTAAEARASGASTLAELLDRVAAVFGLASDVDRGGGSAPGATSVSMRHLGAQSTLVLLNGRRVSHYALANFGEIFTNVDALPFAAIDRVEILKAGASSVYGSEAVAGVINIITKTPANLAEVQAEWGRSLNTRRLNESRVALNIGHGAEAGGATEFLLSLEFYQRGSLIWRDAMQHVNPEVTAFSPNYGTLSTYSWPGNVMGSGALPGCVQVENGLCMYDRYSRFEAVPRARRAQLFADLRHRLSGERRLFGELSLSHTETRYIAPLPAYQSGAASTWTDPRDQTLRSQAYLGLPANHPLNATGREGAELRYRFIDTDAYTLARSLQYRVLLGLASETGATDWEASLGAMGGQTQQRSRGSFSARGFAATIGEQVDGQPSNGYLNQSYRIGGTNSAAVVEQLFPTYGHRGRVGQVFADLRWNRVVPTERWGAVQLSAGAELRHESFELKPSDNLLEGDIVGLGMTRVDASRAVASGYLEAMAEPMQNLTARTSLRLDQYEGQSPRLSPALGLRWRPHETFTLRGGFESGFRAPNLVESANGAIFNVASQVADPQRCLPALRLYPALLNLADSLGPANPASPVLRAQADAALANECNASMSRVTVHNPDLKPETSRQFTAGLVVRPALNWEFSADLWSLRQTNQIQALSVAGLLAREGQLPPGAVQRQPLTPTDRTFPGGLQSAFGVSVGPLQTVNVRFDNIDRITVLGADIGIKGAVPTPVGRLVLKLDAVNVMRARLWDDGLGAYSENVVGIGDFRRWRAMTTVALETQRFTHSLMAESISGEALSVPGGSAAGPASCAAAGLPEHLCRTAGWTRWDYSLQWRPAKAWQLGFYLYNVTDKREPVNLARWLATGSITPPTLEDAKGRMVQLSLRWQQ